MPLKTPFGFDVSPGGTAVACRLPRIVDQRFRRSEVGRREPLGKPIVGRREELRRLSGPTLITPRPGEVRGGTQFPGQGALPARPVEGLAEVILGCRGGVGCTLQQRKPAL